MATYDVYIDRTTGTWGIERDLVVKTLTEDEMNKLEELSDSQLIQTAYAWETEQS